jgi:glycine cleavage system transcriptional repressor
MEQLIITAVGPDRPGIVGELTGYLHGAQANILESRMVNLRGQFAMLLLVEAPEAARPQLGRGLPALAEQMALRLTIVPQEGPGQAVRGLPYRLRSYSADQPGIVARLTRVLRERGVNIEELSAREGSAPFAGMPLFTTDMRLSVPPTVPLGTLRRELEDAGVELNCDVDLDPA